MTKRSAALVVAFSVGLMLGTFQSLPAPQGCHCPPRREVVKDAAWVVIEQEVRCRCLGP